MDNMEWVKGFLFVSNTKYFILPLNEIHYFFDFIKRGEHVFGSFIEVFPETVGESTGLIVTNEEVFQGDFLKCGNRIFEVFWNNKAFQWQAKQVDTDLENYRTCHGCHDYDWTITDLGWFAAEEIITRKITTEIIGNKWDNPEIVEKNRNRKSDYFRCMEEHECLDCDERCSTYGDRYFFDNEPLDYCKNCFYEYRKDGVDDE